jgi:predicted alpha/beta-fold hydrolase
MKDGEVLALDIVFPATGHDTTRPVFVLFTGLVGGSDSKYVKDLGWRGRETGSTIITVVHRGHMDLPLRYGETFHTARLDDRHHVGTTIRDTLLNMAQSQGSKSPPPLVAVGYSAGASMLATYLVRYGKDAAVDAAMAFSGSLDLKFCAYDQRSQRIWQNVFATEGRTIYLDSMEPNRVHRRLDDDPELRRLYHKKYPSFHEIIQLVAGLNGYRNTDHYIEDSTALGDLMLDDYSMEVLPTSKQIHNLSIPLVIVNSLDDPISPWRSVVSNHGAMHPAHLTQTGNGRLMMLITRRGGHVSWPVGWYPTQQKWSWMSHLALSFAQAFLVAETASDPNDSPQVL